MVARPADWLPLRKRVISNVLGRRSRDDGFQFAVVLEVADQVHDFATIIGDGVVPAEPDLLEHP